VKKVLASVIVEIFPVIGSAFVRVKAVFILSEARRPVISLG